MMATLPLPRFLPVVVSELHWKGAPAGELGGGGSQRCGVVPGPGRQQSVPLCLRDPLIASTAHSPIAGTPQPYCWDPTALLLGRTHPEPLLLLVPPSPLSGGAVQIQQSLQSLLLCTDQCLLTAPGHRPCSL